MTPPNKYLDVDKWHACAAVKWTLAAMSQRAVLRNSGRLGRSERAR